MRGYAEVLRSYTEIMGIRRRLAKAMLARAAGPLHRRRFVATSTSASSAPQGRRHSDRPLREPLGLGVARAGASASIARAVNRILVMFPFEQPIYEKAGVPVTYVGHPLADMIPLEPKKDEARAAAAPAARAS